MYYRRGSHVRQYRIRQCRTRQEIKEIMPVAVYVLHFGAQASALVVVA
jgi:hypothetical protein